MQVRYEQICLKSNYSHRAFEFGLDHNRHMIIPDATLREFQEAYRKNFNENISLEESREMLSRLVMLYQLLIRPYPGEEENLKKAKEHRDALHTSPEAVVHSDE